MVLLAEAPPETMDASDASLVDEARRGDRAAFGRLVARHERRILALTRALLRDAQDAQDAAQEAFVRAFRSLDALEDGTRFAAWVAAIAAHAARDAQRARQRQRDALASASRDGAFDRAPTALAALLADEGFEQRLDESIQSLPDQTRLAIELRFRKDLSYREVAAVLGVPESTVRGLLYRGTKTLRERLAPEVQRGGGEPREGGPA